MEFDEIMEGEMDTNPHDEMAIRHHLIYEAYKRAGFSDDRAFRCLEAQLLAPNINVNNMVTLPLGDDEDEG